MAYASEILKDQVARDNEISLLLGLSEFGISGGGIVTILFGNTSLFEPLWVGAAVNLLAFCFLIVFLRESNTTNQVSPNDKSPNQKLCDEVEKEPLNRTKRPRLPITHLFSPTFLRAPAWITLEQQVCIL
jgi:hypothetical protein